MKNTLMAGVAGLALAAGGALAQVNEDAPQGGEMVVTYQDDVATLDPAIGYDWQNWSMIKSLFDGLMGYEPGTTTLRNELAASHEISGDGMVHTFVLKDGIKFHNGREITAEDVQYSLERVTNPETRSPGAGFFGMIAGFDTWNAGEGDGLSGVEVLDDKTVRITLSRPDATFSHVMALNFASIVPREAVEASGDSESVDDSVVSEPPHAVNSNAAAAREANTVVVRAGLVIRISVVVGLSPSGARLSDAALR